MLTPPLLTIGYEATTIDAVVTALLQAGVRHLIDVRAVPLSRKPGFSKRQLAATLDAAGIAYTGLRGLGTPRAGRDAARRGDRNTLAQIYAEHLRTDPAQIDFAHALEIARAAPACLLCFEADAAGCHRHLLAQRMLPELAGAARQDLDIPGRVPIRRRSAPPRRMAPIGPAG